MQRSRRQALVEEGPRRIRQLIDWGTHFDREGAKLAFTREAAHSRRRVLHAKGDATGREINRTLLKKVGAFRRSRSFPTPSLSKSSVGERGCDGVSYIVKGNAEVHEIRAKALLLASGGIGATYRDTTNPDIATGDGHALAFRAGAALADMEFVQFHPTALKLKHASLPPLRSDERGRREAEERHRRAFMVSYHPLAELAPRDVVSRAIFSEANRTGTDFVYLDLSHLPPGFVKQRFPKIYATCLSFGLDITQQPIPVFPAAHYVMGGILTDVHGRTTLPGLFAAGEVACTGVHGANRLASNSLLEGLVYGARAGCAMATGRKKGYTPGLKDLCSIPWNAAESASIPNETVIRTTMSELVGIVRGEPGLREALVRLNGMAFGQKQEHPRPATSWTARISSPELRMQRAVPIDSNHWALALYDRFSCCSETTMSSALETQPVVR